jgi:hypothetical protein
LRNRERTASLAFYEALGGPDWIQQDFWGSDKPVSDWHGVETDAQGRVVRLTIYDNNLEGTLSPAICGLARLHTLHLSFNKISGPLPEALGNCRALKNLWLKGNELTGHIPDSVALLPELEFSTCTRTNCRALCPRTGTRQSSRSFEARTTRF